MTAVVGCAALLVVAPAAEGLAVAADRLPSGQRVLGNSVVEPVYDADRAGLVGFISTPDGAPLRTDPRAWAPLYLPVYPVGSTIGTLICPHLPIDKCPGHGPVIAGFAQSAMPGVYSNGVLGHDHVTEIRGPGFHVAREPIVVLFTSTPAANKHLLTGEAISAAISSGNAIAIPLPRAVLHGAQVSTATWNLATPIG